MTAIPEALTGLAVGIHDLQPFPGNPRRGDIQAIADSLRASGQYRPIVVSSDGVILAGNHTHAAALSLGWTEIAAIRLGIAHDTPAARRIVLADNRTADLGTYDDESIRDLLRSLDGDLQGTGYDSDDLADLEGLLADDDGFVPAPSKGEPVSRDGDVWMLGRHRLAVGDAADPDVLDRLMQGSQVALLATDPPYGVDYIGKTKDALTIRNDGPEGLQAFLANVFTNARRALAPGAVFYWFAPTGPQTYDHHAAARKAGYDIRVSIAWVKDRFVLGRRDFHARHEAILYGWMPGDTHTFNAGRDQDDVWEMARPAANPDHPTMKPVELYEKIMRLSSHPGDAVLDCFAGSGTALLAAERTGRTAYCIEIDPAYADVICARYLAATGEPPIREADGLAFEPRE